MSMPIQAITYEYAQKLRRKPYGTNEMKCEITTQEVEEMKKQLDKVYPLCNVTYAFAEKICKNNKVY